VVGEAEHERLVGRGGAGGEHDVAGVEGHPVPTLLRHEPRQCLRKSRIQSVTLVYLLDPRSLRPQSGCLAWERINGLFAGGFLVWFELAGAGFFERKTLLAGWFGLPETNKRTGCMDDADEL